MITLIAAMDEAGGIGYRGSLPGWSAPGDLREFRRRTEGRTVVMGRRTYTGLGGPLPARTNVVVTRGSIPGVRCARTVAEAIALAAGDVCVIGGAGVFADALPHCTHAAISRVYGVHLADVYFPVDAFNALEWAFEGRDGRDGYDVVHARRVETGGDFKLRDDA